MSNTGGPAFPQTYQKCEEHMVGMTLRDYFAANAIQAMFTGAVMDGLTMNQDINCDKAAETAYTMADAMLKEREQK